MKKTILNIALAVIASTCLFIGTGNTARADDHPGRWDKAHHYYVDDHGYWDEHDKYQKFIVYRKHHGYWDTRGDKRVFIQVQTW
ncbi:MAG TPA: hypothetical protein VG733_04255 [Chthoniobacteraceae bacterium]|nr:hypothetical protein [Chthoniobacteraceae bacterium]